MTVTPVRPAPAVAGLEAPEFLGEKTRNRWVSLVLRVSVPALILVAWWYTTSRGLVSTEVLASPGQVVRAFWELLDTGQLWDYGLASFQRAGLGVGIGVSVALVLGLVAGLTRLGEELVDATVQIIRVVPFLALVPLFISWFGVDEAFKVALIAVSSASPMYAYTYLGVRSVDRKVVEAVRGFGLGGWRLALGVIVPSALPNILMALRICLGISLVGLIAAEQVGATEGIGYLVTLAQQYYRNDYMVLCIVIYALIGIGVDLVIRLVERTAMPWRRHGTASG
ncbi:ABC-type aliphatic sulfonates transporter,permease subunit [Saccharothrix espanaensis DSM 44229]|uniref:ABC-type aliphatic sulfonates transporter,permease subunit n=1 Tax=Saccharothrix espanaensis (strain ATCC 51144 / DSM 44229 / JCM 9112 / NBRC 15066 / NRRL 15764) TaxID=1179773 RepID=K0JUZ6_SACES|nr:ABC-type aliphatic sulfonates transporter,permease subunit [Saccharothrix espanaensis DSM 44229]